MGKNAKRRRKQKEKQEKKLKKKIKEKDQIFDWKSIFSRWDFWIYIVVLLALIAFPFYRNYVRSKNMDKIDEAVIHTSMGDISLELYPEDAPKTVDNFVKLSRDGFYDGLIFHRVIEDFMIQGGDPTGDGTGGPGYAFEDEINDHKVVEGSLAMANSGPDTNGSQFFIVTGGDQPHLDGKHTVFGQVTSGLDVATEISKVETDDEDKPLDPVVIESIDIK